MVSVNWVIIGSGSTDKVPSHYLNQWWLTVMREGRWRGRDTDRQKTRTDKTQWDRNTITIHHLANSGHTSVSHLYCDNGRQLCVDERQTLTVAFPCQKPSCACLHVDDTVFIRLVQQVPVIGGCDISDARLLRKKNIHIWLDDKTHLEPEHQLHHLYLRDYTTPYRHQYFHVQVERHCLWWVID